MNVTSLNVEDANEEQVTVANNQVSRNKLYFSNAKDRTVNMTGRTVESWIEEVKILFKKFPTSRR
jgi:hypothetical protein